MKKLLSLILLSAVALSAAATPHNIAPKATVTASSWLEGSEPGNVTDGRIRIPGQGNWISKSHVTFWGEINYPWIQLDWEEPQSIEAVTLYDLPGDGHDIGSGILIFSDGSREHVLQIPSDGSPRTVRFAPRTVSWMRFEATDGDGSNLGLSEIEVFPSAESYTDRVSYVDPYIETTRGRYFFFVTGSQPFGMIGAAPITRNKNQDGGGYNYNSSHILGFPQVHGWMLSGLTLMPVTGNVNAAGGENAWRSKFSHDGEIVQPGYHRLFLDDYNIWVEQTATDRSGMYRLTFCDDAPASILVNLGGYLSTTTMTNAHAYRESDTRISGYFDTRGRLWGGPESVRIFFVVDFSEPFVSLDSWNDGKTASGVESLEAADICIPRNEGMSYADAPSAGLRVNFASQAGKVIMVKTAISYTNLDNARCNLVTDNPGWDFDKVRADSQSQWNEWLNRIDVEGGTPNQRVKFYTDLWHALLGRRKINDANGYYPDYTDCDSIRDGKYMIGARLKVRRVDLDQQGQPKFNMYNSDAFWLSQWNLNILWGLAYPEVLDDFAASCVQYSLNGGLLPRGPNAGGYSFIMTGCPASSLIASAFQQGLTHRWDTKTALREMKRNHLPGGMQGYGVENGLRHYIKYGYCPGEAGLTIQWAFEDYVLSEMAASLGMKKDAAEFLRRSSGWPASMHPDIHLLLPRRADGSWVHEDPLSGWGYIEANAWQATFGLSHQLPRLAEIMGGADSLCNRLDYAFRKAASDDFIGSYGNGYVSYGNQPGLSNAHVFAHAGKPWLTQYWVRRVQRQAYSGTSPDWGYGGHDEDQGQMGALSALMAMGIFSIDGCASRNPVFDITSPVFDTVKIKLDPEYYNGSMLTIKTTNNSTDNCYIQSLRLNGTPLTKCSVPHSVLTHGGLLEIVLGDKPNYDLK